jgi:hypothetical protein
MDDIQVNNLKIRAVVQWCVLVATIVALGGTIFEVWSELNSGLLKAIFAAVSVILVGDKASVLIETHNTLSEARFSESLIYKIPGLLAQHKDIITFKDFSDSLNYLMARVPSADNLINTAFRYNKSKSSAFKVNGSDLQNKWLKCKKQFVSDGKTFREIFSIHFDSSDDQVLFANQMVRSGRNYEFARLDEFIYRPLQFIILDYGNQDKEVMFGWHYPAQNSGPTFLSRHSGLISFFEAYFAQLWELAREENKQPSKA